MAGHARPGQAASSAHRTSTGRWCTWTTSWCWQSSATALFQQDTVWTTAHGRRLIGWDEIDRFTRQVLPGSMRESTATYEVEHVLFLGADVTVVNIRQRAVRLDGEPFDGAPEGRPVYVVARTSGGTQAMELMGNGYCNAQAGA